MMGLSKLDADTFTEAFETRSVARFLKLMFPPNWGGVAARIIESGVTFAEGDCAWAPRWSRIPLTVRTGPTPYATAVKSCIYRVHDCIHQLWGLPQPFERLDIDDFYAYKRAQMCGEVAVLTLTEFDFAHHWYQRGHQDLKEILWSRNAVPLLYGPLLGKSTLEVAQRLDDVLHKKTRPRWVRDDPSATAFVDDYVPMLEYDRRNVDCNWNLMKAAGWRPTRAPNSRYDHRLDGLELTQWMIHDFQHLMGTDDVVDEPLRDFNRARRADLVLPEGWNGANREKDPDDAIGVPVRYEPGVGFVRRS